MTPGLTPVLEDTADLATRRAGVSQTRTYAVPFDRVWHAALDLIDRRRPRWTLQRADDLPGAITAEMRGWLLPWRAEARLEIGLDADGQTHVEMYSMPLSRIPLFGAGRRQIRRFLLALDRALPVVVWLLIAGVGGCTAPEPESDPAVATEVPADAVPGRTFERALVFTTTRADSAIVVPWLFEARARPGGVDRTARAWLGRNSTWEPFLDEAWEGPQSPAPWRLLPHGPLRLIVDMDDALVRVAYQTGSRNLEIEPGELLTEWNAELNESIALMQGRLFLGDASTPGVIFDLNRAHETALGTAGDFMLLTSGDSVQMMLHAPPQSDDTPRGWRGITRVDFRNIPIDDAAMESTSVRFFDPARSEVPTAWLLTAPGAALSGSLTAVDMLLEAGTGEGPQFPVLGISMLQGTLIFEGREYRVQGLYRHNQGI